LLSISPWRLFSPAFAWLFAFHSSSQRQPRRRTSPISSPTLTTWRSPATWKSKPRQPSPATRRWPLRRHGDGAGIWHPRLVDNRTLSRRTGYRRRFDPLYRLALENRLRPLMRDHAVNPVFTWSTKTPPRRKTILEIVGHDAQTDLAAPNGLSRREHQHEAELKLILSSNLRNWNLSENFISEKDLSHRPMGVWLRGWPHARAAQRGWAPGMRLLRGEVHLGSRRLRRPRRHLFSYHARHLALPRPARRLAVAQRSPPELLSGFGLTGSSLKRVYRIGLACEFEQIGQWFHSANGGVQ